MINTELNNEIISLRKELRNNILEILHKTNNKKFITYVESILRQHNSSNFNLYSATYIFGVDNESIDTLESLVDVYFGLISSENV